MRPTQRQDEKYTQASKTFGPALQRLARATEANPDLQRDLLQDMHLSLWRSMDTFDGRCSLSTWVYRVAHNVAAAHAKKQLRARRGKVPLDSIGELPDGLNLSGQYEESDAIARLNHWIRKLKPPDRQVLTLYLEDLDAAEIADITGITPGAVATRISRLKAKLNQDFKEATHD